MQKEMRWNTLKVPEKQSSKQTDGFWQVVTKRHAGRIRKEGGSGPMANFKDPIHHRQAWAC